MDSLQERILTNLRKGVLEFCVLAHLRDGPTYGLDLARRLEADQLVASEGTLYPLLARLRASGFVETEWIESEAGRPRKYYTLTDDGAKYLDAFRTAWPPLRETVDQAVGIPS